MQLAGSPTAKKKKRNTHLIIMLHYNSHHYYDKSVKEMWAPYINRNLEILMLLFDFLN